MRILTVRQPWAWAVFHGKDVENRTRNIAGDYRGPVAIHAAAGQLPVGAHMDAATRIAKLTGFFPFATLPEQLGVIVGVVDLVDSHPVESCIEQQRDGDWLVCSEWAERSGHHLVLGNPRPLAQPIPFKGALGLRRLPDEVAEMVRQAVAS